MALSPAMLEMLKRKKAQYQNSNNNIKKCKEGKTKLRILAVQVTSPLAEQGQFWLDYGVHWIKQPGNPKPLAVVGNSLIVYDKPSPVEAMVEKAILSANTDEDLKFFKEMKAKKGVLVNALNRTAGSADASETPEAYELTPTTWGKVLSIMEEFAMEGGDAFDPTTGIDIVIERVGKGLNTEYSVMPSMGKSAPVTKEQLGKVIDLYAMVGHEFFRPGDEAKALSILADSTGLAIPAITGPRSGNAALLTATKPVDDGSAAEATQKLADERAKREAEKAELDEIAAASAGLVEEDDEIAKMAADLEKLKALKAKKPAKPIVSKPAAEEDFGADLTEQLAELDGIV